MSISIARGLLVFGSIVSLGFLAAVGINSLTISKVEIGSAEYNRIIDLNDLRADILPPPLFLAEAYMMTLEAASTRSLLEENVERLHGLEALYHERAQHWRDSSIKGTLKEGIEASVMNDGERFWQVVNQSVIPAMEAGDSLLLLPALSELRQVFHQHRENLQAVIGEADTALAEQQVRANQTVTLYQSAALAAALIALLLLLGGIFAIRRLVVRPIGKMTEYMGVLASGTYDQEAPYTNRSDEIGQMARSVEVFRQAIIDGQDARDAADLERRNREQAESDSAARREDEDQQRRTVIDSVANGLNHMAEGDLSFELREPFIAEYEELRKAFNRTVGTLNRTLSEITGSTDIVQTGSTEISQAADDLSRRTEQQAAALEETAAALDEITTTVRNSASAAEEAGQMVEDANNGARKSGKIVKDAITAMQRIEQSSGQISQIIGVIDDIAFQTNLLALNAGVEAARAGEAGKGFAVVAQEVRELAQRSANAAKEIKDLINNSVEEVGDGVSLVSQTGEALEDIEQHVLKINDRVASIVTSSREQTAGLQEINTAINQMDQVTQQNAAMVEQTNAACQNLTAESGKLRSLVSAFNTGAAVAVRKQPVQVRAPAPAAAPAPVSAPAPAPAPAHENSAPVDSPARSLGKKLASAFESGGGAATLTESDDDWTEF
ncbi:methyl-accepting chemotaxis protein [Hoeflea poritis]|uniref:HAMP domain-containing methyl-accepting chemotaxis protein n=1 Tax=Hoeflea poritis TaxID=2993659 RepID=A0ABT4VSB8_9HYPH|nr:HAMP domain-containing methyl-accepting chemotaxis protein [Hoeflea poritis]MDA4847494.1 HAMP domain-containing methyl-accepting chemotaxis protein [Hoeflea poritis]